MSPALSSDQRSGAMQPNSIVNWFVALFDELGFEGCSSHSGRRTFIMNAARNAHRAGCSLERRAAVSRPTSRLKSRKPILMDKQQASVASSLLYEAAQSRRDSVDVQKYTMAKKPFGCWLLLSLRSSSFVEVRRRSGRPEIMRASLKVGACRSVGAPVGCARAAISS